MAGPKVIKIEGLEELMKDFRKAPKLVKEEVKKAMKRSFLTLERIVKKYPRAPSGSDYVRTGTLGRRWTAKIKHSGPRIKGVLENPTPYGPYVMSDENQAWMHRDRWKTESMVVEEAESDIQGFFAKARDNVRKELDKN